MNAETLGARRVRALLDAHGVRPSRARGQNFVIDPNTVRKVVAAARVSPQDRVIEIGPGAGSLTLGLAAAARSVVAIELDKGLIAVLEESLAGVDNVEVVHGDAMRIGLEELGAAHLVANLPYNIAAALVLKVLCDAPSIETLTVMTQREVGERLVAGPGSRVYGQPSVIAALFATAEIAQRVSRRAFYPVPRVDSVVVRLVRRPYPGEMDAGRVTAVVRAAFGRRRKTLRNALASLAGGVGEAEAALLAAGIDPAARAEQLGVAEFVAVASALSRRAPST
ncbi:MAG: 16S rRNA (adenine(1518)-N(6)/adenine(1519)-N(6))-dimethyltransferase RsmA [Actinomycetota bacterium]